MQWWAIKNFNQKKDMIKFEYKKKKKLNLYPRMDYKAGMIGDRKPR